MIWHEVNGKELVFLVLQNTGHVLLGFYPEFGFDERLAVFYGKD
jgi:hypothetical protein